MRDPITRVAPFTGWQRFTARAGRAGLRVSLMISPRPMVRMIRRQFDSTGVQLAASLHALAPAGVSAVVDEQYADDSDARLDVYSPGTADREAGCLPTIVWIHGGGFVGGSKDEIGGYLRMIASAGLTVVGVNYSRAPEARYPTPVRQVMAALQHLEAAADRLHVDPSRLVLAGDSAGAHIAAQVAAVATNTDYAERMGVEPTITPDQLRGVALCCGVYDLALVGPASVLENLIHTVAWAYSGIRQFRRDDHFMSTMAVARHVTDAFPPAFVTVGNADPLVAQSRAFVAALESNGVEVDTLFYLQEHQPPLPHEYQFDLSLDDGRIALQRLLAFIQRRTDSA